MGLVKTRRLAAMQKQQRAKAGLKSRPPKVTPSAPPQMQFSHIIIYENGRRQACPRSLAD